MCRGRRSGPRQARCPPWHPRRSPTSATACLGPSCHGFRLGGVTDPAWQGRVVVRVPGAGDLSMAREAAALSWCARHGYGAPALLEVAADADNDLGSPAVFTARPEGMGML